MARCRFRSRLARILPSRDRMPTCALSISLSSSPLHCSSLRVSTNGDLKMWALFGVSLFRKKINRYTSLPSPHVAALLSVSSQDSPRQYKRTKHSSTHGAQSHRVRHAVQFRTRRGSLTCMYRARHGARVRRHAAPAANESTRVPSLVRARLHGAGLPSASRVAEHWPSLRPTTWSIHHSPIRPNMMAGGCSGGSSSDGELAVPVLALPAGLTGRRGLWRPLLYASTAGRWGL